MKGFIELKTDTFSDPQTQKKFMELVNIADIRRIQPTTQGSLRATKILFKSEHVWFTYPMLYEDIKQLILEASR